MCERKSRRERASKRKREREGTWREREGTCFLYWTSGRVRCISPSLLLMCVHVRESAYVCVCECVSV